MTMNITILEREEIRSDNSFLNVVRKICISCDETIPQARVEALPNTTMCVRCANIRESSIRTKLRTGCW